jgi:hypothetical protein
VWIFWSRGIARGPSSPCQAHLRSINMLHRSQLHVEAAPLAGEASRPFIESRIAKGEHTLKPDSVLRARIYLFKRGTMDDAGRYRRDAVGTREDLFRQCNL